MSGPLSVARGPLFLVLALAVVGILPAAPGEGPKATDKGQQTTDDVQDFVFLAEARPVLIRLHARIEGKPLTTAWNDFMKHLFAYLDVNGDGVLSRDEADRAPTVDQIQNGGISLGGGGLPGGRGAAPARPNLESLDTDKDGKVSPAELNAWYRKNGLAPFQVQANSSEANPIAMAAAAFGGRSAEPTVDAVSKATFSLLDADRDGKLSKDELAAAPTVLLGHDEDEDEIVTAREVSPTTAAPGGLLGGVAMSALAGNKSAGNGMLIPLAAAGEVPANLVKSILDRYGAKGEEPKLTRKEIGLDEAAFKQLDTNTDGSLDEKELPGFVKRAPDLELVVRQGKRDAGELPLDLVTARGRSPLAGAVRMQGSVALLDLGLTRVDLRDSEEAAPDRLGGFIQQQYVAGFKQADADNDGVVDEKEAGKNRLLRGLFKALDRDGDGKVTEKEFLGYLDDAKDLQERVRSACVTLVLSDESRGMFDLMDQNRDGRLSVREMRGAVKLLGQFGKDALAKTDIPRHYEVAVKRGPAETGGPGGPAAFLALYGGGNYGGPEPTSTAGPLWFRKMDRNRDGDVSRKEFLFSDEEFKKLDTDGDGLISVEEAEKAGRR